MIFDEQKISEQYGKNSCIHKIIKETCLEFLQNIHKQKGYKDKLENCKCLSNKYDIDILLEVISNEGQKYHYIIENKKNAELSCTKTEDGKRIRTQIEKYYKEIKKEPNKNYIPVYVFLCAHDMYLDFSLKSHIDNKKGYQEQITVELPNGEIIENVDLDNKSESWLLEKFSYTVREYSDLVNILHSKIKENLENNIPLYDKYFTNNGILKASRYNKNLFLVFKELCNKNNDNNLKRFIQYYLDNEINEQKKDVVCFLGEKRETEENYPKMRSSTLFFHKYNLKNILQDKIETEKDRKEVFIEILCQFIEYWELHYEMGNLLDNVEGYSKLIDGEYILKVCEKLSDNKAIMTDSDFPIEIKIIIKEAMLYKIFAKLKILLENNNFKNVKSNEDILFEEKLFEQNLKKLFNDELSDDDKQYIYWDNHILIFDDKLNHSNKFYIHYCADKDEICIKNKEDSRYSFLLIKNPSINLSNEEINEVNRNLEKFRNILTR